MKKRAGHGPGADQVQADQEEGTLDQMKSNAALAALLTYYDVVQGDWRLLFDEIAQDRQDSPPPMSSAWPTPTWGRPTAPSARSSRKSK